MKNSDITQQLIGVIQEHKLTDKDLVEIYSDLGVSIGGAIEGIEAIPPTEELQKRYMENPTLGISMIIQSLYLKVWIDGPK